VCDTEAEYFSCKLNPFDVWLRDCLAVVTALVVVSSYSAQVFCFLGVLAMPGISAASLGLDNVTHSVTTDPKPSGLGLGDESKFGAALTNSKPATPPLPVKGEDYEALQRQQAHERRDSRSTALPVKGREYDELQKRQAFEGHASKYPEPFPPLPNPHSRPNSPQPRSVAPPQLPVRGDEYNALKTRQALEERSSRSDSPQAKPPEPERRTVEYQQALRGEPSGTRLGGTRLSSPPPPLPPKSKDQLEQEMAFAQRPSDRPRPLPNPPSKANSLELPTTRTTVPPRSNTLPLPERPVIQDGPVKEEETLRWVGKGKWSENRPQDMVGYSQTVANRNHEP